MMILHHGWRSSASRRVRLCLEEKGLAYEGHVVDMAKMEHHSPEYLKINPLGVIPTLIHDGRPLHESGTICEYLDETFPDSAAAAGYALRARRDAQLDPAHRRPDRQSHHFQLAAPSGRRRRRNGRTQELAEKLKNIPSKERQEAWLRGGAQALHRGRARRGAGQTGRAAGQDGRGAEAVRLAGRQGLFDRRYRRSPLRQAHRRGNRAG